MKIYVRANSKKEINQRLESKETVYGDNYSAFGGGGTYRLDDSLPDGTVIAVYSKMVGGSPYAKSWGTWNQSTQRVK